MTGLPWFKCYPRDFNDGMMGLTMEERGAYVTILNCIYQRGTPVHDDPLYFRAMLQCSGKAWSRVRASLIVKGRLFEVNVNGKPCLMDERAALEIENNLEKRRELSERGARGGRKSQALRNENNDIAQAPAQAGLKPGSSDTESEADKNTTATNVSVVERAPKAKATRRCPDAWLPSEDDLTVGLAEGLNPGEIERALAKMRDHTFKTARSDWSATFRNWLRADAERKTPRNDSPDKLTARLDNYDASWTGSERAAGLMAARRAF